MGYALARWQQQALQRLWQTYMAEALRLAGENAARLGGGSYLQIRWAELTQPKTQETRTPKQVKDHMLHKLRGT